jgi:hypothetical protein
MERGAPPTGDFDWRFLMLQGFINDQKWVSREPSLS